MFLIMPPIFCLCFLPFKKITFSDHERNPYLLWENVEKCKGKSTRGLTAFVVLNEIVKHGFGFKVTPKELLASERVPVSEMRLCPRRAVASRPDSLGSSQGGPGVEPVQEAASPAEQEGRLEAPEPRPGLTR